MDWILPRGPGGRWINWRAECYGLAYRWSREGLFSGSLSRRVGWSRSPDVSAAAAGLNELGAMPRGSGIGGRGSAPRLVATRHWGRFRIAALDGVCPGSGDVHPLPDLPRSRGRGLLAGAVRAGRWAVPRQGRIDRVFADEEAEHLADDVAYSMRAVPVAVRYPVLLLGEGP